MHLVNARADAGDILGQEAYPLPRGLPVDELNEINAARGAALLAQTVRAMAGGTVTARAQEDSLATAAPRIRDGAPMVDFAAWPAERVWHFLRGLFPRFREPLLGDGVPAPYDGVLGFAEGEPAGAPGSMSRNGAEWQLHCRDGHVRLRVAGR